MTATIIPIESEAQWLAERCRDVTSTEVAALFGCSPYLTEFELWHAKRNGIVEKPEPNERMRWGSRLEAAIAAGVAEDLGLYRPHKANVYARLPDLRLGASFDWVADEFADRPSPVLLEIKNVDRAVYWEQWTDDGTNLEAPPHIEFQLQTQLAVLGLQRGYIVALVGGNDVKILPRERDDEIGAEIRRRVAAFWRSVEANEPPQPNYERDSEFIIKRLCQRAGAGRIDADAELEAMLAEWHAGHLEAGDIEVRQAGRKARILQRIGDADRVMATCGTLSCAMTKAGYRQFRFTPTKDKKP